MKHTTTPYAPSANRAGDEETKPLLAITLGDVAGVGPELAVRGWSNPSVHAVCRPLLVGSAAVIERELGRWALPLAFQPVRRPRDACPTPETIACLEVENAPPVADLPLGQVHGAAGQAAYDYLTRAIDLTLAGEVDGIVTLPLHKEGLHQAGLPYPGHTEIVAEKTATTAFGMMLYRRGLGVLHVTLHTALREVFGQLTTPRIYTTITLLQTMMRRLGCAAPRIAVAALNPHAGDGGLFGDEEARLIAPAIAQAVAQTPAGESVVGPLPTDTLFVRAAQGEFDGVVAMYHDQGHIALKLLGWREAVNITVGVPLVRTSVAHGTAYDIVGTGQADPRSLWEAIAVAAQLCRAGDSALRA